MWVLNAPHLSSWLRLNDEKSEKSCWRESDDFLGSYWKCFPRVWLCASSFISSFVEIDSWWKLSKLSNEHYVTKKAFSCVNVSVHLYTQTQSTVNNRTTGFSTVNKEKNFPSLLRSAKMNLENSLTRNIDFLLYFFGIDKRREGWMYVMNYLWEIDGVFWEKVSGCEWYSRERSVRIFSTKKALMIWNLIQFSFKLIPTQIRPDNHQV